MFDIGWSELLILAVVTLLFVGPKELPVFLRTIGRYAGLARRQANEFKAHFDAAMREAELAQMKEEMEKMQATVNAEVMGAEKVFKDAGQSASLNPVTAGQASSFTAAAQAAVFPVPAPTGQVYVRPTPSQGPVEAPPDMPFDTPSDMAGELPAATPASAAAKADTGPPMPQAVKSES